MGKIGNAVTIWTFLNLGPQVTICQNWQCKSGLWAAVMDKFLPTRSATDKTMYRTNTLQHIKELNQLMWNSSYYSIKRNLSFFYLFICTHARMRARMGVRAQTAHEHDYLLFVQKIIMFLCFCCQGFWIDFSFDFNFNSISLWASCTNKVGKQSSCLCRSTKSQIFIFFWNFLLTFVFDSWYNASVDKRGTQDGGQARRRARKHLDNRIPTRGKV